MDYLEDITDLVVKNTMSRKKKKGGDYQEGPLGPRGKSDRMLRLGNPPTTGDDYFEDITDLVVKNTMSRKKKQGEDYQEGPLGPRGKSDRMLRLNNPPITGDD